jgi:ABC-type sugar transport system substrate-binding protein
LIEVVAAKFKDTFLCSALIACLLAWAAAAAAADKVRIGYSGATVSNAMLW